MLANIFQLSGAIMTILAIISLSTKDIQKSVRVILPMSGRKIEKTHGIYLERSYGYIGLIYIFSGYVLPTLKMDIGEDWLWSQRLALLLGGVFFLVSLGIIVSRCVANWLFDKEQPFDPDQENIPHGAIMIELEEEQE